MLCTDLARCNNGRDRALWGAEFQGGPISTSLHYGRKPTPNDLHVWALSGLACGMTGISFWNHRVERFWKEANGFGLLDPVGDSTERMQAVSRIGKAIQRRGQFFSQAQPPRARVALLVNEDLYHFFQACNGEVIHHYRYNMRGHYARLWRLGIAVDFLDADEVAAGDLRHYQAAILTMPLSLDSEYFAHLIDFAKRGGMLISEACPGRWDKYGWCTVTQLVDGGEELFGAKHADLVMIKEPNDERRWMPEQRRFGEFDAAAKLTGAGHFANIEVLASFYLQSLQPSTAEAILMNGDRVAGVMNRVGEGSSVLIGTFLGFGALAFRDVDQGTDRFLEALLGMAGVSPDRCGRLLRRRREYNGAEAWFFINAGSEPVSERISKDGFSNVRRFLDEDILEEDKSSFQLRVAGTSLACVLLE